MQQAAIATAAEFPEKLQFLFEPKRFKVAYGGRGGAKSWGFARALLIIATQRKLRVLCAREFQGSIAESVHQLLCDQITALGFDHLFAIEQKVIRGPHGSEFFFEGIKHNTQKIKSYEGIDICWVEEANLVTKASWNTLIPTIRRPGSEIWITFNPDVESDYTYQIFVKNPRKESIVVKMSWQDNPWFPQELDKDRREMQEEDPDSYLNIWEGHCRLLLEGAVYKEELRNAYAERRITSVPWDSIIPVDTFWDIGRSDNTSIWFAQQVGMEYRVLDFYENRLKDLDHYLLELQQRKYVYRTHWLPHDAKARTLGTKRTIEEQVRSKLKSVQIVPSLSVNDGIAAVRTFFKRAWFDERKCEKGLHALKHYEYKITDENGTLSKTPVHNWASHCFEGNTKILTNIGTYAIEDLPYEGKVLTPCGWKAYRNPRITRKTAPLVAVSFSDGFTVKCTPDHLFLTESGWKSAELLQKNSVIQSISTQYLNISTEACINYTLEPNILAEVVHICTEMFGQKLLGKYLQNATYTIKTFIERITALATSNAYMGLSTYPSTGKNITEIEQNFLQIMHGNAHQIGINPKRDGFGIGSKHFDLNPGLNGQEKRKSVFNAKRSLWEFCVNKGIVKNSAIQTVKPCIIDTVTRPSRNKRLPLSQILDYSDVWCLTVPEEECFSLENGAVVHNCADATRYMAIALKGVTEDSAEGFMNRFVESLKKPFVPNLVGPAKPLGWMQR